MSLPRMSWHIGDYKKDTGHLKAAGHGAYFLLSLHYWATGGLPHDDEQLATIACMTSREWKKHKPIIKALFKAGEWKHKRIDQELQEAQEKYEKLSTAGKEGNAKRWGSQKGSLPDTPSDAKASPVATAMGSQPITDNLKKDAAPNGAHPKTDEAELFERGKKVLGKDSGGLIAKLLKSKKGSVALARAAIEQASEKENPREYIGRVLAGPAAVVMENGERHPEGIV